MNGIGNHIPACSAEGTLRPAPARRGFTLVELLVVIVVIAILIALLVPAINGAIRKAKEARMGLEVSNIVKVLETYKMDMGSYPPDFATLTGPGAQDVLAQMNNHLARKFRYRNVAADALPAVGLDPAEAAVFWLRGFSPDPKRPLTGAGDRKPFFEFDQSRLDDRDGDGFPEYYPDGSDMPFVYIHNRSYGVANNGAFTSNPLPILNGNASPVYAYAAESTGTSITRYAGTDKFQILCAGLDGKFGTAPAVYPDGVGYSRADEDNITSFSEGKTLEEARP